MHYILLLFALFLTACNTTTLKDSPIPVPVPVSSSLPVPIPVSSSLPVPASSALPVTYQDTDVNDLKVVDEESIVGEYTLKRGMFRNQEIKEGYLVIEEIDVNNYGYYYVTITSGFTPELHTGIFYKQGGTFVQKVIEDSSESEIRQGKHKSKMSIIDNISLTQAGELLKLNINSTKKEKLIWTRDIDNIEKSIQMVTSLNSARHEYLKYYQEKCAESADFCGDSAYTRVNE